jgi:arylsulfatase A-like enzyme
MAARPIHPIPWLAWVGLFLCACGEDASSRSWTLLSQGHEVGLPASEDLDGLAWGGQKVEWERGGGASALRLVVQLPASVWTPLEHGIFWAPRPLGAQSTPGGAEPASLNKGDFELPRLQLDPGHQRRLDELGEAAVPSDLLSLLAKARDGAGACMLGSRVLLAIPEGQVPPEGLRLEEPVPLAWESDGRSRIRVGGVTADGMTFFPGAPVPLGASEGGDRVLRFSTVAMGRVVAEEDDNAAEVRFILRSGSRELLSARQPLTALPAPVQHRVALPADLDPDAPLTLEAIGPLCLAAVLVGRITPAAIGRPAHRPWGTSPPDLVLFIADTFRADNMAAWGGDPKLTPNLNRYARDCRRYLQAQSPATWTLPAHAAFFSALYPPQLGVLTETDVLPAAAWTLAEHLRAAGYRTAAVTEGAYLSASFGMAQGFEWFEEHTLGLAHTLERAEDLLERDDGRPLFLLVHTYAAHAPYDVSAETRARLSEDYPFAENQDAVIPALVSVTQDMQRGVPTPESGAHKVKAFEDLYRGGAADLDLGFQRWLEFLQGRGYSDHGLHIFISDHGEAFGEHGSFGHGSAVWQEQSRVPFLVHGPGIEPESISDHVSLIDLPRTVAGLVGVAPHPGWMGRDLWGSAEPAPVFTFQTREVGGFNDWAVTHGGVKWILPAEQEGEQVASWIYNLDTDGGETQNLLEPGNSPALSADLLDLMQTVRQRLLKADTVLQLSAEERARLKALGYAGED